MTCVPDVRVQEGEDSKFKKRADGRGNKWLTMSGSTRSGASFRQCDQEPKLEREEVQFGAAGGPAAAAQTRSIRGPTGPCRRALRPWYWLGAVTHLDDYVLIKTLLAVCCRKPRTMTVS